LERDSGHSVEMPQAQGVSGKRALRRELQRQAPVRRAHRTIPCAGTLAPTDSRDSRGRCRSPPGAAWNGRCVA
jgi:hypothetical protein